MTDDLLQRLDKWAKSPSLDFVRLGSKGARDDMAAAAARIRELESQVLHEKEENRWAYIAAGMEDAAQVAVKVKPLVWDEHMRADVYRVASSSGQGPKAFTLSRGSRVLGWYDEPEAAKAAAQADYAARILATIEAVPAAEVWRRAMEAAAQAADDMRKSLWTSEPAKWVSDIEALHDVAAAIRALPMPADLREAVDMISGK